MKFISVVTVLFLLFTNAALAQEPIKTDTLIKKLDSLAAKTDSAGRQDNNIEPESYNDTTKLTGKTYFVLLGSTLKQTFTKPFRMKRKDWSNLGKFALIGGVLYFADEPVQQYALKLRNRDKNVRDAGSFISKFGYAYEAYALTAFGAYGFIFKNEKVKTTTLLATQSVITSFLVQTAFKTLTGRTRPNYYSEFSEAEPRFLGPFGNFKKGPTGKHTNGSFPSGHTTAAFAAATVFSVEYKDKPLIPIIAYTSASLVGLSRITENKHWFTDVFAGAALGYLTGRLVSYNYHRYAKIKNDESKKKKAKKDINISLGYNYGTVMPTVVWKF